MPTGFSLPHDTPLIKQAKMNSVVTSNVSPPQYRTIFFFCCWCFGVTGSHAFAFICAGEIQGGLRDDEG